MAKIAIYSAIDDRRADLIDKIRRGGFEPAVDAGEIFLIDVAEDMEAALAAAKSAKEREAPVVVILTARMQLAPELARIVNDFIIEPYSEAELLMRLKRLAAVSAASQPIQVDDLVIHPDTYEALLDGAPLNLTYKEYELLKFLASHPERVWARQALLNQIWEYDYYGGTRTVDVHVRRLRAKLGRYGNLIQTVRQVGYKFSKSF